MKLSSFLVLMLLKLSISFAQKTDSIKYAHGHLFYHIYGSGAPIVMLSGGPGVNYRQLEEVGLALSKTNKVIFFEQRGTGRSMPEPFDASTINIDAALNDLNLLLDHLKLRDAHFLGHSWGGMLAMGFAANFPSRVKSLILLDPGPHKFDKFINEIFIHNLAARLNLEDRKMRDSIFTRRQSPSFTKEDQRLVDKWELMSVFYDRTKVDSLMSRINKGGNNPKVGSLLFQSMGKQGYDLTKKLSAFKKPVHIISGSQDPGAFVSYEIKLIMSQTRLLWINEAGHFPMFEQPKNFYRELNQVLENLVK